MTRLCHAHARRLTWAIFMGLACPTVALGLQVPGAALSEDEVISRLTSRNAQQMMEALETIRLDNSRKLAADVRVSAFLRSALIEALAYYMHQRKARSEGKPYDAVYFGSAPREWQSEQISYVVAPEDEAAMPVLLQTTDTGWWAIQALLDFGPMVVTPAIECTENDARQYMTVVGCMRLSSPAVYMWRDRLNENEVARLHALTRRRLSKPLAAYPTVYSGALYVTRAALLALVLGWTDEYRALTHARMEEMDPENVSAWMREATLHALTGKTLTSLEEIARSRRQGGRSR